MCVTRMASFSWKLIIWKISSPQLLLLLVLVICSLGHCLLMSVSTSAVAAELNRLISFLFESTFHSVVAEKDQFHNSETVFYASIFFIFCQKRDCIMYLFENHQIPTVTRAHFHFIIPTKGISILHYLFLQ